MRTNLSEAIISGQISSFGLQRFISKLSKAKSLNAFDQVLAELHHANRLISSGAVAEESPLITSAKQGREYNLGARTVKIDPFPCADALYLGTDGLIYLDEVKNTAKALRNKLKKKPKQLKRMQEWRAEAPDQREIRIIIGTEVGWSQVFAKSKNERRSALEP